MKTSGTMVVVLSWMAVLGLMGGPAWGDVITFKNGLNGYNQTRDGGARAEKPTMNFGGYSQLSTNFEDSSAQELVAFYQFFDLFGSGANQVPLGKSITNATLHLYVAGLQNPSYSRLVNVYTLLKDVNVGDKVAGYATAGEVCWEERSHGLNGWGSGSSYNGPVSGLDYATAHAASTGVSTAGTYVSWDVTDMVNDWYTNAQVPGTGLANKGFLIRGGESTIGRRTNFYATEAGANYLPYMEVTFVPEPMTLLLLGLGGLLLRRKAATAL